MGRRAAIALWLGAAILAAGAASADAVTLTSQVPSGSVTVPTVRSHDEPIAANDARAADDFTVGAGQVWTVTGVDLFGLAATGSGTDTANATIYADAGGTPGAALYSRSGIVLTAGGACSAVGSCDFTVPTAGSPRLEPGTYWVSIQTAGPYRWHWAITPPGTPYGAPAVWENPGDGFGRGCPAFAALLDCGWVTADEGRDLIYRLEGALADSRFTLGAFRTEGRKVFLDATFPGQGKAKLKGKSLKKSSREVPRAGERSLKLKLRGGARRRLERGKNLKLKVEVTFTATDGAPFSQTARVKLIPVRPVAGAGALALRIGG